MKKSVIWIVGYLLLILPGAALCDEGWSGNINALAGIKMLNSDWDPVDQQIEGGIMLDLKYGEGPWSFVTYMTYSADSDTETEDGIDVDFDGNTQEICVGLLYTWDLNFIKLYAGGGLGAIRAHIEMSVDEPGFDESIQDNDVGVGPWAGGGVYVQLINHINIGLDIRGTMGDVKLFEGQNDMYGEDMTTEIKAGGIHCSVFAGYHW